jgi:NAD-dependent deacetylase
VDGIGEERDGRDGPRAGRHPSVLVAHTKSLAALVRERQPLVVLTGAGVSTESGIPDFRSNSGMWRDVDPLEVASLHAFRRDPGRVWSFYRDRLHRFGRAEPNAAHRALAELERLGLCEAILTQNVDGLHTRAGSSNVVELHGSLRSARCLACSRTEPIEAALERLDRVPVPACSGCGGVLKPGVVLFGEVLPAAALERASELARAASLVLVIGSSLEVWPVAGLPLEAPAFAIVNRGPTAFDDLALLKIDAGAGETLAGLLDWPSRSVAAS